MGLHQLGLLLGLGKPEKTECLGLASAAGGKNVEPGKGPERRAHRVKRIL